MLISVITHAAARGKQHPFRGLTKEGRNEARNAAGRFMELLEDLPANQGIEAPAIDLIISSPKARCLATALLFAKRLSDLGLVATSEIGTEPALKAGSIAGQELAELALAASGRHMLVSGHADLAKALPAVIELAPEVSKDGWFTTRPVLFTIDHEPGEPWQDAQLFFCEGLVDGKWMDLRS